jgi:tetratricopeptide (TPR) repeat protein
MADVPDPRYVRVAREAEGYYELQLYEEALERVDRLLAVPVFEDASLAMRAECLRGLERWEEGAAAYEALLGRDPENVSAYVGLGWCRKREGRLDLALAAMDRLLRASPGEGIGLYNLACYCSLDGQRERAIELLARAVEAEAEFREHARTEEDLDPIRDEPAFGRIVNGEEEDA